MESLVSATVTTIALRDQSYLHFPSLTDHEGRLNRHEGVPLQAPFGVAFACHRAKSVVKLAHGEEGLLYSGALPVHVLMYIAASC